MINFQYTDPGSGEINKLTLRTDPYNIEWTYNLNTQVYDTYGGQVIQVLSVNIDSLTIDGQFGREGPFGVHTNKATKTKIVNGKSTKVGVAQTDPRWGGPVHPGGWMTNDVDGQWNVHQDNAGNWVDNATYPKYVGLYQLSQFFAKYFTLSTQGGLPHEAGKFIQVPMRIDYDAGPYPAADAHGGASSQTSFRHWEAFPNDFPEFSRANDEFAPLWKIEFSVYQADPNVQHATKNDAIKTLSRIRDGVGWEAENPWIDPAANPKDAPALVAKKMVSEYKNFLPKITNGDLSQMIWQGISMPAIESGIPANKVFEVFGDNQGSTNKSSPTVKKKKKPGKK